MPDIRQGEYEGLRDKLIDPAWKPDFGKLCKHFIILNNKLKMLFFVLIIRRTNSLHTCC